MVFVICDFDSIRNPDDWKSILRYCIYLSSCLQSVMARSNTKAKYQSMIYTIVKFFRLRMLFKELRIPLLQTPCIWVDNISALVLYSNLVLHGRTKHIEKDYHFNCKKIFDKDI
jgi:hypothetical protein